MLTRKLDTATMVAHHENVTAASNAAVEAEEAASMSASDPSNPILAENARGLREEYQTLAAIAQISAEFIAKNPGPTVITNAAHIFPEGTNTNLGSEGDFTESDKVRRSEAPWVATLEHQIFSSFRGTILRACGL
jgi:hypothetical protein